MRDCSSGSFSARTGEFDASYTAQDLANTGSFTRVATNVNLFRGVPHGFRRYGDKLSASKKWDEVISDGVSWALANPSPGPFEIKSD